MLNKHIKNSLDPTKINRYNQFLITLETNNKIKEANYENIAEYFFIGSLIGILIIILLITFNFFN